MGDQEPLAHVANDRRGSNRGAQPLLRFPGAAARRVSPLLVVSPQG